MALPDPIPTITTDSIAYDFYRIGQIGNGDSVSSVYRTADDLNRLTISHERKRRFRHVVRLDRSKVAADPFDASVDQEYSWSAYTVFDVPLIGVSADEVDDLGLLLRDIQVAGTPDYVLRVIRGES
jgi:hypothetical protein